MRLAYVTMHDGYFDMQFIGVDIQLIYVTMDCDEVNMRSFYVDMLNTVNNKQLSFTTMRNDFVHLQVIHNDMQLKSVTMDDTCYEFDISFTYVDILKLLSTCYDMQLRFVTMRNDYFDV